jgi:hypothetical protein
MLNVFTGKHFYNYCLPFKLFKNKKYKFPKFLLESSWMAVMIKALPFYTNKKTDNFQPYFCKIVWLLLFFIVQWFKIDCTICYCSIFNILWKEFHHQVHLSIVVIANKVKLQTISLCFVIFIYYSSRISWIKKWSDCTNGYL